MIHYSCTVYRNQKNEATQLKKIFISRTVVGYGLDLRILIVSHNKARKMFAWV